MVVVVLYMHNYERITNKPNASFNAIRLLQLKWLRQTTGISMDSILELWIKCRCGDLRVRVSVRVSQPHIRRSAFYPSRLLGRQISSVVEIEGEKRRRCVIYILKFRRRTNIFRDTFTLEVPVVTPLTCDCAVADDTVMPIRTESSSWLSWWGSGVN